MPRCLNLEEGSPTYIRADILSAAEVEAIGRSSRFTLSRSLRGDEFILSSINWVGQIPVTRDLTVRVFPKVPIANLFWMLDVAYSFKSFETWDDRIEEVATVPDMFTRLASMLARRLHRRLQKGLHRSYEEQRDELGAARGRIDVVATVTGSFARPRVVCEFNEHTADIRENQIPLYALHLISRLSLTDPAVMDSVRRAHRAIAGAAQLIKITGHDTVLPSYTRLNEDYRPIHILSKFFIDHLGPSLAEGVDEMLPFCVEMPLLFEGFVAEWLRRELAPEWRVVAKHRLKIDANMEMTYVIDLVIEDAVTGRIAAILDTKYKDADRPSQDDVNQVIAYAAETSAPYAFLIYPRPIAAPFFARPRTVAIEALWVDLGAPSRPDGEVMVKRLRQLLQSNQIFTATH